MSSRHRLQGVFLPQVVLEGRPRDEPISEGVFPLAILNFLDLPIEAVEYVRESLYRSVEFFQGPLVSLATVADHLLDFPVHHRQGGDEVGSCSNLGHELARKFDPLGPQVNTVQKDPRGAFCFLIETFPGFSPLPCGDFAEGWCRRSYHGASLRAALFDDLCSKPGVET